MITSIEPGAGAKEIDKVLKKAETQWQKIDKEMPELKDAGTVRQWAIDSKLDAANLQWINSNVDKWFANGSKVRVGKIDDLPRVTDAADKADMGAFMEWADAQKKASAETGATIASLEKSGMKSKEIIHELEAIQSRASDDAKIALAAGIGKAHWEKPRAQVLPDADAVRSWALGSNMRDEDLRWVNNNVDKWFAEGKQVRVNGANDIIPQVADASGKPDIGVYNEWVKVQSKGQERELSLSEAKHAIAAALTLQETANTLQERPKAMTAEQWDAIKTTDTNALKTTSAQLDKLYADGKRIALNADGSLDLGGAREWEKAHVLKDSKDAQQWIADKAQNGTESQKLAWKTLAGYPGIVRDHYDDGNKLTLNSSGQLDASGLVKWAAGKDANTRKSVNATLAPLQKEGLVTLTDDKLPVATTAAGITVAMGTATVGGKQYNVTFGGTSNGKEATITSVTMSDDAGKPVAGADGKAIDIGSSLGKNNSFKIQNGALVYPVAPGLATVAEDMQVAAAGILGKQKQSLDAARLAAEKAAAEKAAAEKTAAAKAAGALVFHPGELSKDDAKRFIAEKIATEKDAKFQNAWKTVDSHLDKIYPDTKLSLDKDLKINLTGMSDKQPEAIKKELDIAGNTLAEGGRAQLTLKTGHTPTPGAVAEPSKKKGNFFEDNKMGILGFLGAAVVGMMFGGNMIGALIFGAIAFMVLGSMKDPNGTPASFFSKFKDPKAQGLGQSQSVGTGSVKDSEKSINVSVKDIEHVAAPTALGKQTKYTLTEGELKGAIIAGEKTEDGMFKVTSITPAGADPKQPAPPLATPIFVAIVNNEMDFNKADELVKAAKPVTPPPTTSVTPSRDLPVVEHVTAIAGEVNVEGKTYTATLHGSAVGSKATMDTIELRANDGTVIEQKLQQSITGKLDGTNVTLAGDAVKQVETIAPVVVAVNTQMQQLTNPLGITVDQSYGTPVQPMTPALQGALAQANTDARPMGGTAGSLPTRQQQAGVTLTPGGT